MYAQVVFCFMRNTIQFLMKLKITKPHFLVSAYIYKMINKNLICLRIFLPDNIKWLYKIRKPLQRILGTLEML